MFLVILVSRVALFKSVYSPLPNIRISNKLVP
jgi:hypothetical protein